ncbi:malto-oligosyltrehalose trehalohydrolase [Ornithinimicrobium sp. Y1847]|uniref:malto-oligosyltrehalose trehalohydrolase n=1 Tax=Ornithinimicrobium sp. Y1847 TaxID=3405419 RepID=UPI003B675DC1
MKITPTAHRFDLWAPDADSVDILLGDVAEPERRALRRGEHFADEGHPRAGWWELDEIDVRPFDGTYAYSIDGGTPVPDPRSRRQPHGVHGPSRLVDTDLFTWSDDTWRGVHLEDAVVYELHVGTFAPDGTFDGVIEHLDHLVDLGITVIEVMPVASFPGRHGWGYDGVALYSVQESYGGPDGLARLVDAAHAKGLAVWLDVVYNHLGPSGNYLGQVAPYFTDRHHTPWGQAVNLDGPGSDQVRAYLLDNARMWLQDYHLDGLRLDAVHALHDERAVHLLEDLGRLADEIAASDGIPRTLVAESDRNDPATVTPRGPGGSGGIGLHGQWADDIHHALHTVLTGETQAYYGDFADDPDSLPKVLGRTPFFHDGSYSSFRGRHHGRPVDPEVTPGWRYVASLQTHDQIGNRGPGDRIGHGMPVGRAAIGAALLLTAPYTPMLFMGEEWGASTPWQYFTDHEEEWLAESIREGRQREFAEHGWAGEVPDPQDEGTVTASTLRWEEVHEGDHGRLYAFYRDLIRLRRELPGLRSTPLAQGSVWRDPAQAADAPGEVLTVVRGDVRMVAVLGGRGDVEAGRDAAGEAGDAVSPVASLTLDPPASAQVVAHFGQVDQANGRVSVGVDSVVLLSGWPEEPGSEADDEEGGGR